MEVMEKLRVVRGRLKGGEHVQSILYEFPQRNLKFLIEAMRDFCDQGFSIVSFSKTNF